MRRSRGVLALQLREHLPQVCEDAAVQRLSAPGGQRLRLLAQSSNDATPWQCTIHDRPNFPVHRYNIARTTYDRAPPLKGLRRIRAYVSSTGPCTSMATYHRIHHDDAHD